MEMMVVQHVNVLNAVKVLALTWLILYMDVTKGEKGGRKKKVRMRPKEERSGLGEEGRNSSGLVQTKGLGMESKQPIERRRVMMFLVH